MAPLRRFLADDHEIVRYGLRSLLETKLGWTVVGEAADGKAAIEGVIASDPDVTLMDISMPVVDGLQAARQILASGSRTKILMLSIYDSKEVLGQVVDSGACGFVLKSDAERDLIAAVEAIHANGTFFTPKTAEIILDRQLDRMQEEATRPLGPQQKGDRPALERLDSPLRFYGSLLSRVHFSPDSSAPRFAIRWIAMRQTCSAHASRRVQVRGIRQCQLLKQK